MGRHLVHVLMQRGASAGYQCALFAEAWDAHGAQAEVERRDENARYASLIALTEKISWSSNSESLQKKGMVW